MGANNRLQADAVNACRSSQASAARAPLSRWVGPPRGFYLPLKFLTREQGIRAGAFIVALLLLGHGIVGLESPLLHYRNWWGDPVFAPLTLILGLVLVWMVLWRPDLLKK